MRNALNWVVVSIVTGSLAAFRLPGLNSSRIYVLLGRARWQPLLEHLGRMKAYDVARRAARRCPAYRRFLVDQHAPPLRQPRDFATLPETTKANYVKTYSIEDRCHDGRIPRCGVVIDESSGSSGTPNNWVRGSTERASVKRLLQHGYALTYRDRSLFVLNCFALGPWATGMNVSMSLLDVTIMKSIGPDKAKLENTLKSFGAKYPYLVAGYPPFIKDFIDTCGIAFTPFELHLIVGGEGISEALRDRFLKIFRSVHSSYGASDLEINIAAESEFSIALRRLCHANPALSRELFGRDDPPMIFQYNPLDYLIERSAEGELVITILRRATIAPKVRYNIRDFGGSISFRRCHAVLARHGVDAALLNSPHTSFPLLYVYGRSDLAVPFYGAKVFTSDVDAIIHADPRLRDVIHSFQMHSDHDADLNETLTLILERTRSAPPTLDNSDLRGALFEGLIRVNQDFREVSRMFTVERLVVEQHAFGEGPFAARDIRVKNQYIAPSQQR